MTSENWETNRWAVLDSTNMEAARIAQQSSFANQWIVAEQQKIGKGRLGRSWISPKGNLYATALFREPEGLPVATRIPFIASIAVADTIIAFCPRAEVKLKWPNDVLVGKSKISGILVETGRSANVTLWVACGIGINVNVVPCSVNQPATRMLDWYDRMQIDIGTVFLKLKDHFERRLQQSKSNFQKILATWRSRAMGLNQKITVEVGNNQIEGIFKDIENDGALRLKLHDGTSQIIRAGDVTVVKK